MTSQNRVEKAQQARAALIVAAMRRSILTYGELGRAIDMHGVDLRNQMRHVLDDLSDLCADAGEPSLAALVVNAETGKPGQGWEDGSKPWYAEVQQVFRHWSASNSAR